MNIFKSRKSSTWKGLSKVKAEQMADPSFHAPINVITNDSEESLPLLANVERESLPLLANVDQATEATIPMENVQTATIRPSGSGGWFFDAITNFTGTNPSKKDPVADPIANNETTKPAIPNSLIEPLIVLVAREETILDTNKTAELSLSTSAISDVPLIVAVRVLPLLIPTTSKELLKSSIKSPTTPNFLKKLLSDISYTLANRNSVYNTLTRFCKRIKRFLAKLSEQNLEKLLELNSEKSLEQNLEKPLEQHQPFPSLQMSLTDPVHI
jgi:hypothetical protein